MKLVIVICHWLGLIAKWRHWSLVEVRDDDDGADDGSDGNDDSGAGDDDADDVPRTGQSLL